MIKLLVFLRYFPELVYTNIGDNNKKHLPPMEIQVDQFVKFKCCTSI